MKPPLFTAFFALLAWGLISNPAGIAQDKIATPSLDALNQQYEARIASDLKEPHDKAVLELNQKYAAALSRALEQAQKAGNLQEALATKAELVRAGNAPGVPANDDDVKDFESVKQLRATYRTSLTKLDAERDARLAPLNAAFAKHLDELVVSLTKSGKLEEAKAASERRKKLVIADPAPSKNPEGGRGSNSGGQPPLVGGASGAKHLRFQATVPATDVIKISNGKLWIEDHAIKFFPTNVKINDIPWKPKWRKDRKSDRFELPATTPSMNDAKVSVEKSSGRGELKVLTLPAADNGQTLSFEIYDPQADAGDYDISISW